MPWNDNANPGPWGSPPPPGDDDDDKRAAPPRGPNEAPRGQDHRRPPSPPPGRGPRLPGWAERLQEDVERLFNRRGGGGGGSGGIGRRANVVGIVLSAIFLMWMVFGSVYIVQVNEQAVVTRFGAWVDTTGPGLHAHFPWPVEWHQTVPVTTQRNTVIGGQDDESLMLTSDEAIVDLDFMVQWHVTNAEAFVFNVAKPEETVKAVAESAMREVVGRSVLQAIMTNGRGQVQMQTLTLAQRVLDSYHMGVSLDAIQIQSANAPQSVAPAYQELNASLQDQVSAANEGQTYYNRVVNEAKGDAAKIVNEAEGYREQVVLNAQGEAATFNQVYDEYRRAPAVTRERLYLETMQDVLAHSNKVVVDTHGGMAPIVLPPDVFRPRTADTPAATVVAPVPPSSQPATTP